jgi:methylmalonyl-CoA mutase N-terminal domain/subunit
VDPLGGAYALERLTNELESRAELLIRKIDELGGMIQAIERGYPQREIQDAAFAAQRDLEEKRSIVVGVNAYQQEEAPIEGLLRVDETVREKQMEGLKSLRTRRSHEAVKRSLEALRVAARRQGENLVPHILECVKAPATLGEISDSLRDVFGEHKEHAVL